MRFEPFLNQEEIRQLQEFEKNGSKAQKRTPEQIEAIYTNGQNILVSASAGSGKTFVMVERIIDKVLRGISIENMFISTFTVKAANELKERLEKKLREGILMTDDPEMKAYLNDQMQAIALADIGTMDAFTQKLLNEHGYLLGIPPKFRIMQDKSEQELLKNEIYKSLFENYMASDHSQVFLRLVKNFSGNRKDSKSFRDQVYKIYQFSQSTENPKQWLENNFLLAANQYQDYDDLPDETIDALLQSMKETAISLRDLTDLEEYGQMTKAGKPTAKYVKHLTMIEALNDWSMHFDSYYGKSQIGKLAQDLSALLPSGTDVTVAGQKYPIFKDIQSKISQFRHLATLLTYQPETLPLLLELQSFVIDFTEAYLEAKKSENAFEFTDITHFAIEILQNEEAIRKVYQSKYHEVMVDEYQDNNHMQECLLELLSNGHNRFMVGDIKQSIYRFRQADPQIFNQKFKDYQENPENGKLILLKENFRSQSEVIDATNAVFSHLMDEAVGDILYDDNHYLKAGSDKQKIRYPENNCQVLIYDTDQKDNGEDEHDKEDERRTEGQETLSPGEVNILVKEIIRLHQEEAVPFSDITLLVSSRTRNDLLFKTFNQYDIPLVSDGGQENYLKSVEVMVMLDTLRSINNPLNDYALVALMRSPMFAFNEDQLARIALQDSQEGKVEHFYEKVLNSLSHQGQHAELITQELHDQLELFDQSLNAWRDYSRTHSLYELIWKIYNDRFYFDFVGLSPKAEQAQANLYALALRANQFEKTTFKGLTRFISMIDNILNTENDLADVDLAKPKEAVNVMTIHKSKGLEFKYVFILNCDKKFSMADIHSPLILSRQKGVGIKFLADVKKELNATQLPSVKLYLETLPYQINKKELKIATLSEQMRLLYVAMTRAEKKLYLIGKGSQEKLSQKFDTKREGQHLPKALRESITNFQDWLLAIHQVFDSKDLSFTIDFVTDNELGPESIGSISHQSNIMIDDLRDNRQSDSIARAIDMLNNVNQLNQKYEAAINLPTVRTPSQLKKFYQPIMDIDGVEILSDKSQTPTTFELPQFSKAKQVTSSQVGSALHELMQRIKITSHVTEKDIQQASQLVDAEAEVMAKIDLHKVKSFFEATELGRLIQVHHDKLYREAPFAMLKTDPQSQEKFVIRGIVDGFLLLEDKIILFDYKTDHYKTPLEMKLKYQEQMALYAESLRKAYDISTIESYLILMGKERIEIVECS